LANVLYREFNKEILLIGSSNEKPELDAIKGLTAGNFCHNLAGDLSVKQSGALLSNADFLVSGTEDKGWFGYDVLIAEHFADGDKPALLIGAPKDDAETAGENAGKVFGFAGPLPPAEVIATQAQLIISGTQASAAFGSFLGGVDFNGDSKVDLVVSAPGHTAGVAASSRGQAFLYFGGTLSGAVADTVAPLIFKGTMKNKRFGRFGVEY